jgi:hypothetical protein
MSPCELPCDVHSQVPVNIPPLDFFSAAAAKAATHTSTSQTNLKFRFMRLLLFDACLQAGVRIDDFRLTIEG